MDILDITHLTKSFGKVVANDDVTLRVARGEVVGLLGHNGAGKTTLVSQVVGLLRPDDGSIRVGDLDAIAHPAAARRRVALQPQAQVPIDGLTPKTAIELAGRLRGMSVADARRGAAELADQLDIGQWFTQRALPEGRGLSGGVRRLTGFAMAVVGRAPLVILDEPTNDVDAARRRALWSIVRRIADEGAGVLLVTHNVTEAERVVDELVVLDRGAVVASGTPGELRGDDALRLELVLIPGRPDPSAGQNSDRLRSDLPIPVLRRVRTGRRVLLSIAPRAASPAVSWAAELHARGDLDGYTLGPTTLEDSYLALTSSGTARPAVDAEPAAHANEREI